MHHRDPSDPIDLPDDDLYEARLLDLARRADDWPLPDAPGTEARRATRVSRTCGSGITVAVTLAADGRIASYGHALAHACTLTRAAASLLAERIVGRNEAAVAAALAALDGLLARRPAGEAAAAWPALDVLAPVADIPTRHDSVRLPFQAALAALADNGD